MVISFMVRMYGAGLFLCMSLYGAPFIGEWTSKVQENIRTDYIPVRMYCQRLSYIKGGVFIKYPENYFSSAPYVYVSVELNKLQYSADLSFNPIIRFTHTKGVMVLVNKYTAGYFSNAVAEAESDDVFIHVFSFGP